MSYGEFGLFLDDNSFNVILISLLSLFCYILLYKRYLFSIFDPLLFAVVATALANATVFYLYIGGQIKLQYFQSFLITELSFLCGFFIIKPLSIKSKEYDIAPDAKWYDSTLFISSLFYWSSIIHLFTQILTYGIMGLPILMESRLLTYAGGTGFGVVGRITEIAGNTGTILLFYRMFYKECKGFDKVYNYIYLLFLIFFLIVSGNKTNLIFLVYFLFLLQLCMNKLIGVKAKAISKKISRVQLILFVLSIPIIFLVIYVQYTISLGSSEGLEAGTALLFRILSFGDIFYMTFPHEVILRMNHDNAFLQLFKDFIGIFRILPWSQLPIDCGIEIANYHNIGDAAVAGPNARYNYFAILYFGVAGQIIYCFIIGLIASLIRNTLFKYLPRRIVWSIVYILLNFNLIYIYQDQSFTFAHNFDILLILPILLFLSAGTYLILLNWNKLIQKVI